MTRWGSGTVPPDETLDRLIRISLQEDFSGYAPDPMSALGELRHQTHTSKRKSRRIVPFLPGLPKTVVAVVCVVLVTVALLVVPRVFHIRAADTKPVTPAPITPAPVKPGPVTSGDLVPDLTITSPTTAPVKHAPVVPPGSFAIVRVPARLAYLYGGRFGPAFTLYGPYGKQVSGALSYRPQPLPNGQLCQGGKSVTQVRWEVWITFWGDVSMVSNTAFSARDMDSGRQLVSMGDAHTPTPNGMATWMYVNMTNQLPTSDTVVPVNLDLTFIGSNGVRTHAQVTAAQGSKFTAFGNAGLC